MGLEREQQQNQQPNHGGNVADRSLGREQLFQMDEPAGLGLDPKENAFFLVRLVKHLGLATDLADHALFVVGDEKLARLRP